MNKLPDFAFTVTSTCFKLWCLTLTSAYKHSLEQLVEAPYRENNILDLLFTSKRLWSASESDNDFHGVSDQYAALVNTLTNQQRPKPVRRKIYILDKADLANLKQGSMNITTTQRIIQRQGIDTLSDAFRDNFLTILKAGPLW